MQILGPFVVFRLALDSDARSAGVAPVVNHDAAARLGDLLAQRADTRAGAPAARLQSDKRAALAQDLVVDIDAADTGDRHAFLPGFASDRPMLAVTGLSSPLRVWRRPRARARSRSAGPSSRPRATSFRSARAARPRRSRRGS